MSKVKVTEMADTYTVERLNNELRKHNICEEKVELFNDFSIFLINNLYNTYLGKDCIRTKEEVDGHFEWCYEKTLKAFSNIGIDFSKNKELKTYFYKHAQKYIYKNNKYDYDKEYHRDIAFFNKIFTINKPKNQEYFILLIDLFNEFNRTFKK